MNDVKLLPCPFACCAEITLDNGWARHAENDCVLSNVGMLPSEWNRREPAVVESASPYDKAVAALAPLLPLDVTHIVWMDSASPWAMGRDAGGRAYGIIDLGRWNLPQPVEGDTGARRILNGAVVPSNGQEP